MGEVISDLKDYKVNKTGMWLKFEEGTTAVRLLSHVYTYKTHFNEEEKKSYVCAGNISTCQWCQEGSKPKQRWAYLVLDRAKKEIKVMEVGFKIFEPILALAKDEDYGDPRGYDLKITRKGSGMDTSYTVIPGKVGELEKEETELIKSFKADTIDKATDILVDLYQNKKEATE